MSKIKVKVWVKVKGQDQMSGVYWSALGAPHAESSKGNYPQIWSKAWSLPVRGF